MTSNETAFMDSVAEALQLHLYLVNHNPRSRTGKGAHLTAVKYDGAGYYDLTAMRPQAPVIFIECKDEAAVTPNQKDWQEAGQGDGRFCSVLRPRGMPAFLAHLKAIDEQYPVPRGWRSTLITRQLRLAKKKMQLAPPIESLTWTPVEHDAITLGKGKIVYIYRGRNKDGSVCVYGPMTWTGVKWVAQQHAKYRSLDASVTMKKAKERKP